MKTIDLDKLKCPICGKHVIIQKVTYKRDRLRDLGGGIFSGIQYASFAAECSCGLKLSFESPNYKWKWSGTGTKEAE